MIPQSGSINAKRQTAVQAKPVSLPYMLGDNGWTYDELNAGEVNQKMKEGWTVLDVRNEEQVERAAVKGAVHVPLFVTQDDKSPYGLYREALVFGLGGWWMGARPTVENPDFLNQVKKMIPENGPGVVVICQSGLRSRQAVQVMHNAGYQNLALLEEGLNNVKKDALPTVPEGANLRTAGAGSIAGKLGWRGTR